MVRSLWYHDGTSGAAEGSVQLPHQPRPTELLRTGRVTGYQGHHIKSVGSNPGLAGNPNNIRFVRPGEHLDLHGGNWKNPTWGQLIFR